MSIDVLQLPSSEYEATVAVAMGIDAPNDNDVIQYKLCCNTWLLLFSSRGVNVEWLESLLREQGFYATIDDASSLAQKLCDSSVNLFEIDYSDVNQTSVKRELIGLFHSWVADYDETQTTEFISLLRFPKRFTASRRKGEVSEDYLDFVRHNQHLHVRMSVRTPHSDYVISRMKFHVNSFFTKPLKKAIHKAVTCYLHEVDVRHHIPTGVCADARTTMDKLLLLQRNDFQVLPNSPYDIPTKACFQTPYYLWVDVNAKFGPNPPGFTGPVNEGKLTKDGVKIVCDGERTITGNTGKKVRLIHGILDWERYNTTYCTISSVPKSFDEERIIGMEQTERQVRSDLILPLLYDRLLTWSHGTINLNDQSVNRDAARRGSIDGSLATIDWHHASDGYSIEFVRAVMPSDVMSDLEKLRARFFIGKENLVYNNNIFLTMGHKLTPALQSLLFMCLCRTAEDVYSAVTHEQLDEEFAYDNIFIYNDDTIVPSCLAELVLQFGEAIGLEPNMKKTFFTTENLFRESCGGEYFQGVSLTPYYWPRTEVSGKKRNDFVQYYDTLVSVQHRIYGYRKAATYFELCLRAIYPKITYSNDLTDSVTDLFGPFRTQMVADAPHKKDADIIDAPFTKRTLHSCVVGTWPKARSCSRELEQWADYVTYLDYLKYGPMYASPLDELLGVSMRRDPSQLYVDEVYQFTVKRQ